MFRRYSILAFLIILPLLTSCQPERRDFEIVLDASGEILFDTEEPVCFEALRVYDEEGFVWQILTDICGSNPFPAIYGKLPQGFNEIGPLRHLVAGRRYGVTICGGNFGAEARREFVMPPPDSPPGVVASDTDTVIQSPQDRDDARRAAAIKKGEWVPTIQDCSRTPAE